MIASGTGRNRHAFWPLTEPLAADEVERGNRRLAHALGADPASADAARILRVPATYSHKHQPPVPVDALRLDIEQRMPGRRCRRRAARPAASAAHDVASAGARWSPWR